MIPLRAPSQELRIAKKLVKFADSVDLNEAAH